MSFQSGSKSASSSARSLISFPPASTALRNHPRASSNCFNEPLCETHLVEFRWLKGHARDRENERCDQLSMIALRQPNLPADDGYENKPETESVRPAMQEGEPCRKCPTPVIKRNGKLKPGRAFYYEYHMFCPKCQTLYHIEGAKRFVEQPPSLF